jgi:hypothetical protein
MQEEAALKTNNVKSPAATIIKAATNIVK